MAQKFVEVLGLSNVFNPASSTALDTTTLKPEVASKANSNSILFMTAIAADEQYGYPANTKYIWTRGKLYNANDTNYTFSEGDAQGQIKVIPSNTASYNINIKGLGSAAYVSVDDTVTTTSLNVPNSSAVASAISTAIASAVIYKGDFNANTGDITGGGTMTSVAEKVGDMYIASTAGTFAGTEMEVGDSVIFKKKVAAGTAVTANDVTFVEKTVSVAANNPTLSFGATTTIGTVEGVDLKVTMPNETITDVTVSGSGNAITGITLSGTTITATKDNTFASNDHSHGSILNNGTINASVDINVNDSLIIRDATDGTIKASTLKFKRDEQESSAEFLSSAGYWETINPISVNGTSIISGGVGTISVYAPTSTGTSGQYLMSTGSGIPVWRTLSLVDEKVKTSTSSIDAKFPLMAVSTSSVTSGNTYEAIYDSGIVINPNKHSVAEGINTTASGTTSHAEGDNTTASGWYSHVEGANTKALGTSAHAEGTYTTAIQNQNHAEGRGLTISLGTVKAVGSTTQYTLSSISVTIEGSTYTLQVGDIVNYGSNYAKVTAISGNTITVNQTLSAAVENNINLVKGVSYGARAHSEGYLTAATENQTHAEGYLTIASNGCAHAEGSGTKAAAWSSHAEGSDTIASGSQSHAGGLGTIADQTAMTAIGKYNVQGASGELFAIGNGISASARKTVFKISDANGNTGGGNSCLVDIDGTIKVDSLTSYSGNSKEKYNIKYSSTNAQPQSEDNTTFSTQTPGLIIEHYNGESGGMRISEEYGVEVYCPADNDIIFSVSDEDSIDNKIFTVGEFEGGYILVNGRGTINGSLNVTDRVNATQGFFQTSDINKKNIVGDLDLDKAYELIDKCQTILYTLKDDKNSNQQVGLIAQEVKEFFPELITEDKDGSLSLDYSRLTVVILKVLKDIINRIKILESK